VRPVVERGARVAVCLESAAAELARKRGYGIDGSCPSGLTPVFKRVVGIPEDRIRVAMDRVAVNGAAVRNSELKEVDSPGLPLEHTAEGEIVLTEGRFVVMGMNPSRSSDSRHFGAVSAHQVVAGARPLWTFLGGGRGGLGAGLKRRPGCLGGRQ
jgi:conjugative transfer signal peptidase TraF